MCVVAVNNAGSRDPSEFSCKRYECRQSPVLTVMAWIIGGLFALPLLVVIGTLICGTYQKFRKGKRDSTDELAKVQFEHCSSVVV